MTPKERQKRVKFLLDSCELEGHYKIDEEIGCGCKIIQEIGMWLTDKEIKEVVVKK
jgi:hypothetical protein